MAISRAEIMEAPGYKSASYLLFGTIGVIAGAHVFEYFGYAPCPLCLVQRYAYYVAIPLAFIGLVALSANVRLVAGLMFLFAGLGFVANSGLGIYHSGIEWGWWPGPEACASPAQTLATDGNLLSALQNNSVISCTEASFRFLGLSFAGWNAVISGCLAALGLFAANSSLDISHED